MKKIVTHAGVFHPDETSAIALLLRVYPDVVVERTYDPEIIKAAQADDEIMVLDIGRVFEPEYLCLDHHQDPSLPASNMLVLHWIGSEFAPKPEVNYRPIPNWERVAELLEKNFFGYISRVDVGEVVEDANTPPTINSIIRACNNLPGTSDENFYVALGIMSTALDAQICTAQKRIEAEEMWKKTIRIGKGQIAVWDSPDHIVGWHEMAEVDGVKFLITPNARGGYQITSRSSDLFPIPVQEAQTFRHNSGFLAVYADILSAIAGALEIIGA